MRYPPVNTPIQAVYHLESWFWNKIALVNSSRIQMCLRKVLSCVRIILKEAKEKSECGYIKITPSILWVYIIWVIWVSFGCFCVLSGAAARNLSQVILCKLFLSYFWWLVWGFVLVVSGQRKPGSGLFVFLICFSLSLIHTHTHTNTHTHTHSYRCTHRGRCAVYWMVFADPETMFNQWPAKPTQKPGVDLLPFKPSVRYIAIVGVSRIQIDVLCITGLVLDHVVWPSHIHSTSRNTHRWHILVNIIIVERF